jgi:hypothetical protein
MHPFIILKFLTLPFLPQMNKVQFALLKIHQKHCDRIRRSPMNFQFSGCLSHQNCDTSQPYSRYSLNVKTHDYLFALISSYSVIMSTSAYPILLLSSAFFNARNLTKRAFSTEKVLVCHNGLFLMLENSPSLTIFHFWLSDDTKN